MHFNKTLLGTGLIIASAGCTHDPVQAKKPAVPEKLPNIIYVFADQLRADVLGYAGDEKAITPNIDRFASEAVDYTNCTTVSPVSTAHRASLLTGKYTSSTGMIINEINMNPNHRTIAHVLSDAGYNLGYVGKMHLNDQYFRPYEPGPERFGFDGYWAAYTFNHNSYGAKYHTDINGYSNVLVDLKGEYSPAIFTELFINFIKGAVTGDDDRPFAAFLSWNPPHDPWVKGNVDPKCYEKFKDTEFELPENFKMEPDPYMDRYPGDAFENGPDGKKRWKQDFLDNKYEQYLRCYYAMNNSIDEQFGRILDVVDELGIADNTIIIFSSDHGEMFASQGRMYKLTFYDEAARVPFLVRAPKGLHGVKSDVLINTPDIMPTILGLAGLGDMIPKEVEGMDLSHTVYGKKGKEPEFAFLQGMGHTHLWQDGYEWRAVRDKRYTYAKYLRDGSELLFDRQVDPHMINNVIDDPQYKNVVKKMRSNMESKLKELNDQFMPCTWYRDNWMYKKFSVAEAARGKFGPIPPVEPNRR